MDINKQKKLEELRKRLLQLNEQDWEEVLDNSDEKPQHIIDKQNRARILSQTYLNQPEIRKKAAATIKAKGNHNAHMRGVPQYHMMTPEAKENWRNTIDLEALANRLRDQAIKRRKQIEVFKDGKSVGIFESCLAASKVLPIALASITNMADPNHKTQEVKGYTVVVIN